MGTLIDTQTILTAAHINLQNQSITSKNGYTTTVTPNSFYPSIASMYTVYLGLQSLSNLTTATIRQASNIIMVRVL